MVNVNIKSKSIIISLILGALILLFGVLYIVLVYVSRSKEPSGVVIEPGNPRVNYTQGIPEELKNQMISEPTAPSEVAIEDSKFVPQEVRINKYSVVTFVNKDKVNHNVKGASGKWGSYIELKPDSAYSQEFDVAGVYEYFCPLHPEMKGKVVVE